MVLKNHRSCLKKYIGFAQQHLARESIQKILKSIHYLSSERLIKLVVGLFIHAYLARYLGPEKFGSLSYVINFAFIFLPFVTFGLDDVLPKHFLANRESAPDIVMTQIRLRLVTCLLGYCILVFLVLIDSRFEFNYKLLILFYGASLFFRVMDVVEIFSQANLNLRPVFMARNIGYVSSTVFKALGVLAKFNISFFVFSYFWEGISSKFFNFYFYRKSNSFGQFNRSQAIAFLKESYPLFLGSFVLMLDQKLGHITLKHLHGNEAVGNFSLVMILIDLWAFLPAAICGSLYPAIYNAKTGLSGSYSFRVQLLYDFLIWLGILFGLSVTFAAPYVIQVLYSQQKFPELTSLLAFGSWMAIFGFLSFARVKFYVLENKLMLWVSLCFFSLLSNVGLQLFLVPKMHEKGVLISMISSPMISVLFCSLFSSFVRKELRIILKSLWAPVRVIQQKI